MFSPSFTRKKLALRCLGTFLVSCANPVAGAIVGAVNIISCYREIQEDRAIAQVMSMPVFMEGLENIVKINNLKK